MSVKKKIRFYILTSASNRYLDWINRVPETNCNFVSLKTHFDPRWSNIDYKDAVVVINTLDSEYETFVYKWCKNKGIECHITESNGSPGKGKNELLKIFQKSDDDYMVQVDGDDTLTPYGVYLYKRLANENPPDSIIIYHQWAQSVSRYGERIYSRIMNNPNRPANHDKNFKFFMTHMPPHYKYQKWFRKKVNSLGGLEAVANKWATLSTNMHSICREYNETYFSHVTNQDMVDNHCRPVWYSKKAAKYRFDETMRVGEDTLFYLYLKTEHYKGKIKVKRLKEVPCTYVYNNIYGGIVTDETNGMSDMSWMSIYKEKITKAVEEGKVGKYPNLPELQIDIPDEVNDYYITQDFDINSIDIESIENKETKQLYQNIKDIDKLRKELKDRIKKLEEISTHSARKLVWSVSEYPNVTTAYLKNPWTPNIPLLVPLEHGMEQVFQRRIIL